MKGAPTHVVANGRVQFADGKLKVERGAGRFVERKIDHSRVPHLAGGVVAGRLG